jgi:hypothetical protein
MRYVSEGQKSDPSPEEYHILGPALEAADFKQFSSTFESSLNLRVLCAVAVKVHFHREGAKDAKERQENF